MVDSGASKPGPGLSIGEVARLAGVTTRAVRHYHAVGLVPEPARASSGYRQYRAEDLVALVRVARLRVLGMPIADIRARITATEMSEMTLSDSLRSLADELDGEIQRLSATRDRLRDLAGSEGFGNPADTLAQALRARRLLDAEQELAAAERTAAELLDALHPGGMSGVVDQAAGLLGDREAMTRLAPLIERFRALDDRSSDTELEALAADFASALPRPEHAAPPIDTALVDKLLGDRLSPAQRRLMHLVRRAMDRT
jgi:DNA-binding transcriptional MerR regulator